MNRISKQQLRQIAAKLSLDDHLALTLISEHRFLTADHVAGIIHQQATTPLAAVRAAQRQLRKLEQHGLAARLPGRTGGVGGGASRDTWHLTEAGHRTANPNPDTAASTKHRHRTGQPSTNFLNHTLMIADIRLALEQLDRQTSGTSAHIELAAVQTEPACWRAWTGAYGVQRVLKPDLYIETTTTDQASGEIYDDHWFIEADQNTEHQPAIIAKAKIYQEYQASGTEQAKTGIFPLILWITPNQRRADTILNIIASHPDLNQRLHHATPITGLNKYLTNR
jgi:hypothetical protein